MSDFTLPGTALFIVKTDNYQELIEAVSKDSKNRVIVTTGKFIDIYTIAKQHGYLWTNLLHLHYTSSDNINEDTKILINQLAQPLLDFLKERSMLYPPQFKTTRKKALTRRDLFRAPRALLENIAVPFASKNWYLLTENTRKALSEIYCPYGAINPQSGIDVSKCIECGFCANYSQYIVFENVLLPYSPLLKLFRSFHKITDKIKLKIVYYCNKLDNYIVKTETDIILAIKLPSILWLPWYAPLLHDYYTIKGELVCNTGRNSEFGPIRTYSEKYLEKLMRVFSIANTHHDNKNKQENTDNLNENAWLNQSSNALSTYGSKRELIGHDFPNSLIRLREMILSSKTLREKYGTLIITYKINFDEKTCTICGVCEKACPFEALKIVNNESEAMLLFSPIRCIGCYNCLFACPEHSISDFEPMKSEGSEELSRDYLVIARDNLIKCASCGKPIGPSKKIEKIEKTLVEKGFPEELVIESTRICSECKSRLFLASRFR